MVFSANGGVRQEAPVKCVSTGGFGKRLLRAGDDSSAKCLAETSEVFRRHVFRVLSHLTVYGKRTWKLALTAEQGVCADVKDSEGGWVNCSQQHRKCVFGKS